MKIICSYSSLTFEVEHFPGILESREAHHPVFDMPQRRLLPYLGKYASGGLTETDSYLLVLAALRSTDLVQFRVPAIRTPFTASIIAQNIEHLFRTIIKLNTVQHPAVLFPSFVITPETKDLTNLKDWIQNWDDSYEEFRSGRIRDYDDRQLAKRERTLERMIKNPHRTLASYARQIADWASTAGSFPTFSLTSPLTGHKTTCDEYWKQIIENCSSETRLFSIPRADLEELLEHCETNIDIGSIYSNALFKILRHALEKQKNFLGLGDMDISRSTYEFLEADSSVESANMRAVIQSAPTEIPRPDQYPTKMQYLRAKLRYDMAKKHGRPDSEGESK